MMKIIAAQKNEYNQQIIRLGQDAAGQKDLADKKIEGLVKQVSMLWIFFFTTEPMDKYSKVFLWQDFLTHVSGGMHCTPFKKCRHGNILDLSEKSCHSHTMYYSALVSVTKNKFCINWTPDQKHQGWKWEGNLKWKSHRHLLR